MLATDVIEQLREYRRDRPSDGLMALINGADINPMPGSPIFWTYRCALSDRAELYGTMIDHWVKMARKFHPEGRPIVVDGQEVDMFQRCIAMAAFTQSRVFDALTAFLDNDAFPNANLSDVPIDSIGLTIRDLENYMPINEGVIFAKPTEEAKAFFLAYVGTYEALINNVVVECMGRSTNWWGGQIALNLLKDMPGVALLPCEQWNFTVERDRQYTYAELDSKKVLHLKGGVKKSFDQFKAYQTVRD